MAQQTERLKVLTTQFRKSQQLRNSLWNFAITSGKGGVGKTTLSINLGLALARQNQKVLLIDVDLGMANIDLMLGIVPQGTIYDVIKGNKTLRQVMVKGPFDIHIIPGISEASQAINLPYQYLDILFQKIKDLFQEELYDAIIWDTASGTSSSVLRFIINAKTAIIITTPEPPAIMDAYSIIKAIIINDPSQKIQIIINKADNKKHAQKVFKTLQNLVKNNLHINISNLGFLLEDQMVSKAIRKQIPLLIEYPNSKAGKAISQIATNLIDNIRFESQLNLN